MTTRRTPLHRARRGVLTADQEWDLLFGPSPHRPAFVDDHHRREAWFAHKDTMLWGRGKPGSRPDAWWCYSAPPWPKGARTRYEALWHLGDGLDRTAIRERWMITLRETWLSGGTRAEIRQRVCGADDEDAIPAWFFDEHFGEIDAHGRETGLDALRPKAKRR